MTREEAIKTLKGEAWLSCAEKWNEALDMAISALKEEPVLFDFELFQAGLMDMPKGMTNGEVIQALFPNPHIDTKSHTVWVGYEEMSFTRKWWNAPYQKGGENKDV